MSASMQKLRNVLVNKLGERYGREKWAWLMQKYDILPWDDVPAEMVTEAVGGAAR